VIIAAVQAAEAELSQQAGRPVTAVWVKGDTQ
jgi:hypothetical protein